MSIDKSKFEEDIKRHKAISYLVPNSIFYIVNGKDVWESEQPFPSEEQISQAILELDQIEKENRKRVQRNALLIKSDWTILPHSPLDEEKILEWVAYREALRDFPSRDNWVEQDFPNTPI